MKTLNKVYIIALLVLISGSIFITQKAQRQSIQTDSLSAYDIIYQQFELKIYELIKGFNLDNLRKFYQQRFQIQYLGQKARVTSWPVTTGSGHIDPSTLEGQFIRLRLPYAQNAIRDFTGYNVPKDELPRIGAAFSGGGYRAMILTSGFLKALEELKLLNGLIYISTLSGSTWCLGPWTFLQKPDEPVSADLFRALLADKAADGELNLISSKTARGFDVQRFLNQVLWPKFIFKQPISSIDPYGGALAHTLLNYFGDKRFEQHLSSQWENVKNGQHPWPIYTAVSMHQEGNNYRYNWYEFNPEYVINKSLRMCIPAFAFGRRFKHGETDQFPPERSFGELMGIFGSAYTVNIKDILRIYFGTTDEELSEPMRLEKTLARWFQKSPSWAKSALGDFKKISTNIIKGKPKDAWNYFLTKAKKNTADAIDQLKGPILAAVLRSIPDIRIAGKAIRPSTVRIAPAQIPNPFFQYPHVAEWISKRQNLTFVDAGIDYNIPLLPLFDPERRLNCIIVGDASSDILDNLKKKIEPMQLTVALQDVKRVHGVDYRKDSELSDMVMLVYRPVQSAYPYVSENLKTVRPPIIVYFNFLNDPTLLAKARNNNQLSEIIALNKLDTYSAAACLKKACGTFNFDYSVDEVKQLSGICEFNMRVHEETLRNLIDEIIGHTRTDVHEWGGG